MHRNRFFAAGCIASLFFVFCAQTPSPTVAEDETAPVLELLPDSQTVYVGMKWVDPGYTALDDIDGDIGSQVKVTGSVSTGTPGTHVLEYAVSDIAGNETVETREITVVHHPDVLAWYPFYRHYFDCSGKKTHGTAKGTVTLTADRFSNSADAYDFDGKSFIEVPYGARLDFPGPFTIGVWAKSAIAGAEYLQKPGKVGFVLNMGEGAAADYGIYYHAEINALSFRYNGKAVLDSLTDIRSWHHYAMTFSGSEICGYVDGKLAGSVAVAKGVIADKPFRIGCESKDNNRYWFGSIDDILILGSALAAAQVEQLAQSAAFVPDTAIAIDTGKTDTSSQPVNVVPQNLAASITGSAGSLSLRLSWDAVSGAFAYGVYFAEGKTVGKNDAYRVANNNYRTFSGDLTEGKEYSFAVCSIIDGDESALSAPTTLVFEAPR